MSASVRPLTRVDLPEAQRIVRRAFGTFLGARDLDAFWADFDYVYGRFGAEHVASFGAELDGANHRIISFKPPGVVNLSRSKKSLGACSLM